MRTTPENVQRAEFNGFVSDGDVLRMGHRLCVPQIDKLKEKTLKVAHSTPYTTHSDSTKMYQDLQTSFWWDGTKRI